MHSLKLAAETDEEFFIACLQEYLKQIKEDTKISVRPFDPSELIYFQLREEQQDRMTVSMLQQADMIKSYSVNNISVYYEDKLLYVGGLVPMWENVAEGWLLVSDAFPELFKKEPKTFIKGMRACFEALPFNRIQTPVREGFEQGKRLMKSMGFEEEGLMRKYGPDQRNYHRYALVKE